MDIRNALIVICEYDFSSEISVTTISNQWYYNDASAWLPYRCTLLASWYVTLRWRHNGQDSVSNHQTHDCLLNRLFRRRSKKTSKLRVTGLCAGNSPGTGEFPAQMASYAENVSIWWRHHELKQHWTEHLCHRRRLWYRLYHYSSLIMTKQLC